MHLYYSHESDMNSITVWLYGQVYVLVWADIFWWDNEHLEGLYAFEQFPDNISLLFCGYPNKNMHCICCYFAMGFDMFKFPNVTTSHITIYVSVCLCEFLMIFLWTRHIYHKVSLFLPESKFSRFLALFFFHFYPDTDWATISLKFYWSMYF